MINKTRQARLWYPFWGIFYFFCDCQKQVMGKVCRSAASQSGLGYYLPMKLVSCITQILLLEYQRSCCTSLVNMLQAKGTSFFLFSLEFCLSGPPIKKGMAGINYVSVKVRQIYGYLGRILIHFPITLAILLNS